ncbi:MAG: DNA gyrase subunit B [Clostridiales bacterium]|jgi:DNA gyrase subunit B|nr:DNA gyrase subunit B [Clostridiales bacterium]
MGKNYEAKDIKVLEGLDAVRLRPGMYIGTTGTRGLHHILWEIVDNSIDEISNGHGSWVKVVLHKDGSASVEDDGRGVPVDIHPKMGISGVEVVFTQLHAGGKFDNNTYKTSGGLHGVGAAVANALSRWLTVSVFKKNKEHKIEFESVSVNGDVKGGVPKSELQVVGKTSKRGTLVRFLPDDRIFESIVFNLDTVARRLKELSFLNRGCKIILVDERVLNAVRQPLSREYYYEGGLIDFVKYLNETRVVSHPEPIMIEGQRDGIWMQLSMQYTDAYTENIFSYVNNIPTAEGGTHLTGFKTALTRELQDQSKKLGIGVSKKDPIFVGEDFREGLTAVLSIKMQNVEFEGQTKTKLGNPAARVAVESVVQEQLSKYLDDNKSVCEVILRKAMLAAKVRDAARREKENIRLKNSIENFNLIGKLSNCTGRKAENNELFIVEGDSAGGTAKQARDRYFQAILPLRGKPLNAEKKRIDQVLQNEEIRTIISALGCGIGSDFSIDKLNYHKVVILSDADQDGAHIRAILLTFFFRYMKDLIVDGHVYVGMPPLYKVSRKDKLEYVYDDGDVNAARERVGRGSSIQRYKGLGEMNADQLWDTTMDPARRMLVRVTIEDAAIAEKIVSTLMGDAIDLRKAYIIDNANFNKVDTFASHVV